MSRLREVVSFGLSLTLMTAPVWGAPTSALGTVVSAEHARVGASAASVGSTLFGGDSLITEKTGSVQMRAGAARFLLAEQSIATLGSVDSTPSAELRSGTATFSTANAKAFELHAGTAVIKANTDEPTIGQVTIVSAKEFIVKSKKGSLNLRVDDDSREIPEGMAYRVVVDESAAAAADAAQGPRGVGGRGGGGAPRKAGSSRFVWYAIIIAGAATFIGVHAALESPDRP
jgi:hypothetical protein